jgi:hypothetical protein
MYWTARERMGTTGKDSGVVPREAMAALAEKGWCDTSLCPYQPMPLQKPSAKAFAQALPRAGLKYYAVEQDPLAMKRCLAGGTPFLLCFWFTAAYWSDAVAKSGRVPTPKTGSAVIGGHGNLCVGFDEARKWFIMKGTYGDGWAASGDYTLGYDYVLDPDWAGDFWTLGEPPAGGINP